MKIAFFDTKSYDKEFFLRENRAFDFKIEFFEEHLNEKTSSLTKGFDTVCAFVNDSLSAEVIDTLYKNGVKLIAMRCAGTNNVDLIAAKDRLKVVRVPAYSPYAVAEHAIALMLCLNRKIHTAYNRVKNNNFSIDGLMGFDLHGKTAGVIGMGQIGHVMVRILKGFGMDTLVHDLVLDAPFAKEMGFEYTSLEKLYKESDLITLHCPLTPDTLHMINEKSLKQMKPHVILINTGRGALIETQDLIHALKERRIGAAGLDCYEEESQYFFSDFSDSFIEDDTLARLQTFSNVLITSHQGFFTKEAMEKIAKTTLENIRSLEQGKDLLNEVKVAAS